MKKMVVFLLVLLSTNHTLHADDGMWLPMVLENINDMHALGLKLSADDIYSVNHSSLKDGVVLFGGGCTGEVISGQGLILTNHHCGLGYVQSHSSIEKDYLSNGFWAMSKAEELICPGLSVTFIISMEDVTNEINSFIKVGMTEQSRSRTIDSLSKIISTVAFKKTGYDAVVKQFAYGNQFILIQSQTFNDIRLVGAPPISIGDFGGETDNWVWPRQTGDFSIFRIYADTSNHPASYSERNIPYTPNYFFPIKTSGVQENDFAMTYGFPGKTAEYVSSYAVELKQNVTDPIIISMRTLRLNLWWNAMMANDTTRIQYTSKYNGVANSWKKSQGEILGLKQFDVIELKKQREEIFNQSIDKDGDNGALGNTVLAQLKLAYDTLRALEYQVDYYNEALMAPEIMKLASQFQQLELLCTDKNSDLSSIDEERLTLTDYVNAFYKNYNVDLDRQMMALMLAAYCNNLPDSLQLYSPLLISIIWKNDFDTQAKTSFEMSILSHKDQLLEWIKNVNSKSIKTLSKDPIYTLWKFSYQEFTTSLQPKYSNLVSRINALNRIYYKAQTIVFPEQHFYPDANSTLRLSYGTIKSYLPKDGVEYNWFSTLDGVIQKSGNNTEDYEVPQRLVDLWKQKDFGTYADKDGSMHTCFISTCHTTGGNSGSPVLDANGNLVGTNFDRVWEGTMSDLYFNDAICRNIVLDVRYTLFIVDKYAGAGYLLNEMKLVP